MNTTNQKPLQIPQHIAFIMDGNGRWAKKRNMPRTFGHNAGGKRVRDIAIECNRLGVKAMTVYAFSTENWKRSNDEVQFIFKLPKKFFTLYMKELIENNIIITYIGHLDALPIDAQNVIKDAVFKTSQNTGMKLCFAINYGSRDEITWASKKIAEKVKSNILTIEDITEKLFSSELMTNSLPEIDLMIRTSGEIRLSNFLLWQLAYAELYFTDTLWPDFDSSALNEAIEVFTQRQRRFGGV